MDKTRPPIFEKEHITVLETLPNGQPWNQYWRDGETLWVGKLPKKMFDTGTDQEIIDDVANFFSLEAYNYTFSDDYIWNNCTWETQRYESFVKTVWLAHDFLSMGFSHQIGCHWNPRSDQISIHPGQGRKRILRLFLQKRDEIDVIFFNTGGFVCDWMKNLKPVSEDELENIVAGKGWWCAFTPDHGTFIPHPIKRGISIENSKKEWFEKISSKLKNPNFKIFFDYDIPYLSRWKTKNKSEANVVIEGVTHDIPEIDKATLTILALTGLTLELEFRGVEYKIQNKDDLIKRRV